MENTNLKPLARFPEFETTNISRYKFEEIFNFSTGKNIKQQEASPEFETPCVRYGELYHMYNEVITKVINRTNLDKNELKFSLGNEILLPSAGEDPLDIGSASALTLENIAIGRTINILSPLKENIYSHIFVSYYINQKLKRKISTLAKGSSISNVYNSDLKTLKINLPTLNEQNKIANFLTSIETRITLLKEKKDTLLDFKKGVLQKIFNQEIRFKDDNGNDFPDWEEKKLGEVLDYEQPTKYIVESIEYDNSFETPVLTAGKSFLLGYTDETENIFTDVPVIIFDDFTMANQFVTFPFKVKSSAMKILKNDVKKASIVFVYAAMEMIYYPKGDEHKRFWISEYSKIKIPFPSLSEQTKIANYLNALDTKIEGVQQKIDASVDFKKGLLQQLFV